VPEKSPLHAKLAEVMKEVGYIPKNGWNANQSYKFAAATDVADKVRDAFSARGITCVPSSMEVTDSRRSVSDKQDVVTIRVTWLITDSESGYATSIQSFGSGADTGDKAVYKAMTGALKYALLMAFQIPTGDDPEASGDQGESTSPPAAQRATPPVPEIKLSDPRFATPEEKKAYGAKADGLGLTRDQKYAFVALVCKKEPDELTADDVKLLITKLDEPGLVDMIKDVEKVS
jgi:hypothetical protein